MRRNCIACLYRLVNRPLLLSRQSAAKSRLAVIPNVQTERPFQTRLPVIDLIMSNVIQEPVTANADAAGTCRHRIEHHSTGIGSNAGQSAPDNGKSCNDRG